MKIELFLEKIDQEMIETRAGGAPIHECTYASWKKSCCVINCVRAADRDTHVPIVKKRDAPVIFMRRETDGGLIWDSRSGSVYKVDEEAYQALNDLDNGVPPSKVAKSMGVPLDKFNKLLKKIRKLDK